jgi:hypothetical protein
MFPRIPSWLPEVLRMVGIILELIAHALERGL